jgi:hypothetical protein
MFLSKKHEARRDRTVQTESIRGGEVEVAYTGKALSGWGGLALLFEFGEQVGFFGELERVLPNVKTSPNQVSSIDVVKTLYAAVLSGGNRFAHVERVRGDEVIRQVMGAARVGGADTVRRYFEGLSAADGERIYADLQGVMSTMLWIHTREDVLDLDSTILERYGKQQGVGKGYHTSRAGQTSHHPLLGMLTKSKYIVHTWLRAGGASTLRGAVEFVDELLTRLPVGFKITAIRADSGFYCEPYLRAFEERQIDYIVPVRMHPPMKRLAARIQNHEWKPLDEEHQIADITHQEKGWSRPRRILFIRRAIEQKGALFDSVSYEFSALATSLTIPAEDCSKFYDQRGECENTIKEFKNDFGARGFCMNSFDGTEAVFRLISVLFNLITEFKRQVLRDTTVTLATLRVKVFVIGAMLGRRARKIVLRLGLVQRCRERFQTLLSRASAIQGPTAALFAPSS